MKTLTANTKAVWNSENEDVATSPEGGEGGKKTLLRAAFPSAQG